MKRHEGTSQQIAEQLIDEHKILIKCDLSERLANEFTRLSDDDVEYDEIESMLICLYHEKILSGRDMIELFKHHLKETHYV